MRCILLFSLLMFPGVGPALAAQPSAASDPMPAMAHVTNHFHFSVAAPMRDAAPLFGPAGERAWAGDEWDPHFLFPTPAHDVEGAVFTVSHGEHTSVWVNTAFDPQAGHMQYVYVLGDLLVTTIDVRLHVMDPMHTEVDVTYVRTALRSEANDHVTAMGRHDQQQGEEWRAQIAAYLLRQKQRP